MVMGNIVSGNGHGPSGPPYYFPAELLDCQCFESHLGKLVHHITIDAMVMMATDLGLSDVEVEDYQFAWIRNPAKQRL